VFPDGQCCGESRLKVKLFSQKLEDLERADRKDINDSKDIARERQVYAVAYAGLAAIIILAWKFSSSSSS